MRQRNRVEAGRVDFARHYKDRDLRCLRSRRHPGNRFTWHLGHRGVVPPSTQSSSRKRRQGCPARVAMQPKSTAPLAAKNAAETSSARYQATPSIAGMPDLRLRNGLEGA
jgi:hypothetical protein